MEPRRIVVTGAAGFIGSHVCEALLRRGDTVVGLDNFDSFYDPAIKAENLRWALDHPAFTLVEGDIRDPEALELAFAQQPCRAVVHLAARAGVRPSLRDPMLYDDVNVRGTTSLFEFARRRGIEHFVHASSSSVYGPTSRVPFSEDQPADRPASPYAATKRSNELSLHAFHHLYGVPITCLRFFTAYGPRQRPDLAIHRFARLIEAGESIDLYGDGSSRRDYTYIDDVVDGVLRALDRPGGYRIYNLGTTETTPLRHLAERIAAHLERQLRVRHLDEQPGDLRITCADISRAEADLGYRPRVDLELGLALFVNWFRDAAVAQADEMSLAGMPTRHAAGGTRRRDLLPSMP